jgi:hypothetical protein
MSSGLTPRRLTREQQVMAILMRRGHITEATGMAELGRVQVGSAIWRIKNKRSSLIPNGMEIRSVEKQDVGGNRYVEWQLVESTAVAA